MASSSSHSSTDLRHLQSGHFPSYLLGQEQANNPENRAVFHAAASGNIKDLRLAFQQGGKPNFFYHPEDQKNALHVAAEKGYADIVQLLLENGAVVNAITGKDHATPLILAARLDSPVVVETLARAGGNVNAGRKNAHIPCLPANTINMNYYQCKYAMFYILDTMLII
jgi:ankyrin repeat protein